MGGASPAIKPIGKSVVHRICSGQVIFDLSSAIKELVENSLDAGATSVEVTLKAYGEEWFKVADNGSGISPTNFQVRETPSFLISPPDTPPLALSVLLSFGC
jgi:DNA mismatch repair protein PMS2